MHPTMHPNMHSSRRRRSLLAIAVAVLLVPIVGVAHADPLDPVLGSEETYPDLVPDVTTVWGYRPYVLDPTTNTFVPGPPAIAFDTWSQNLGTVALDLIADDPADFMSTTVSQCVKWLAPNVCRERRQVGGFAWHAEHSHFHYQDFATYELRRVRRDGQVDYGKRGLLDKSDKVSFCLLDSVRVRDDAVPAPTYLGCTPAREGISPGWADIYDMGLEGQQLSLEGLPDGRYAIVVTQDYNNTLFESDDTNNRVEVIFDVRDTGAEVPYAEIVERRYP